MKTVWKVGQWLVITVVLLSLAGLVLSDKSNPQEDAQIADLVLLARTDLAARLGIQGEAIALESTGPLSFPCPPPNNCQERLPGYVIRLRVDDVVYEYNGKRSEQLFILWHEVADVTAR
jgi:hypothetical protein